MVPADVKQAIKQRAAAEWPADYEMQAHTIGQQSEAYVKMAQYAVFDPENEVVVTCFVKARSDWPDDYTMQVYTFENQTQAAIAFFNATNAAIPPAVLEQIKSRAFSEWAGDYEMMLYEFKHQTEAWLSIESEGMQGSIPRSGR